ncbi:hypothetical protein DWQ67_05675 [Galactobacter caseinivorans]|uniref:DUF1023 domain-containing protein n=2 Tax=Galactobacter caseinivorans TaxID=2676123 RepID=A0A496PJL2_9MICC|nr:hypothetical protein DWQ67_05675 [Galactobacter caseinivorans]
MRPTPIAASQSSARPKNLKYFATTLRANDSTDRRNLDDFQRAWTAFEAACSWVPVEQMTLVSGGTRWRSENGTDATFADTVAAAFEKAGSGGLSNSVLAMIVAEQITGRPGRLFKRSLSSYEEAARQWKKLGLTPGDIRALPLNVQFEIENMGGIPASARNVASRQALDAALKDPEVAYRILGGYRSGFSRQEFDEQLKGLNEGLAEADKVAAVRCSLAENRVAQLVGLRIADKALTASISIGNMDTANNVTVNVPGAQTTLTSMKDQMSAVKSQTLAMRSVGASGLMGSWMGSWMGFARRAGVMPRNG